MTGEGAKVAKRVALTGTPLPSLSAALPWRLT